LRTDHLAEIDADGRDQVMQGAVGHGCGLRGLRRPAFPYPAGNTAGPGHYGAAAGAGRRSAARLGARSADRLAGSCDAEAVRTLPMVCQCDGAPTKDRWA
jgi:hypothetical protein